MHSIQQAILEDMSKAQKNRDKRTLSFLRFLASQIKNKEIDAHKQLSNNDIIAILRNQRKQLQQSSELFLKGKRKELAEEYDKQVEIINKYLPEEMSPEELEKRVRKIIEKNADSVKSSGALIGICISELKDSADSSDIARVAKKITG